jgi:hypothetical protein
MDKKRPPDFGDRESRQRKAYERLGTTTPRCLICDRTNPLCLELHHPAQRQFDKETIILCITHHADASDWQRDHPSRIEGISELIEAVAHWLLGLGDLLHIASQEPEAGSLKELLAYVAAKLHQLARILMSFAQSEPSAVKGSV